MSIDKFGNYDTPLSEEEKVTLISFLGDVKKRDILRSATDLLSVEIPNRIHLSFLYFNHTEIDKIKAEIQNRFALFKMDIQGRFPTIPDLTKEEYWAFDIKVDDDNIPRVQLNDWLKEAINKGVVADVDLSKVSDGEWIRYFNRYKNDYPDMVKIAPEMKLIVEINDKLNDIADEYTCGGGFNIDFTDVINEIAQAAKEGKL